MTGLFLLALLSIPPGTAALDRARDLEFERIQVEWIASSTRVPSLESVLPREHAELIRLLGDGRALVRELATDRLASLGQSASLALAWGMRVRDPEIAQASSRLRGRLYACPDCGGAGDCPDCRTAPGAVSRQCLACLYGRCRTCEGSGDLRCTIADRWDDDGRQSRAMEPRDLFGK